MALNPEKLSWTAPDTNTDGTPIDYALSYNMYVDGTINSSFPGSLNPDGRYEIPFADTAIGNEGTFNITLTAFNQTFPEAESDPSAPLEVTFAPVPLAPTDLAIA